jgi:hypothetical protein
MSALARSYLSAPPSSADAERANSTAGWIDSALRSRLAGHTLETLTLLTSDAQQQRARAAKRKQREREPHAPGDVWDLRVTLAEEALKGVGHKAARAAIAAATKAAAMAGLSGAAGAGGAGWGGGGQPAVAVPPAQPVVQVDDDSGEEMDEGDVHTLALTAGVASLDEDGCLVLSGIDGLLSNEGLRLEGVDAEAVPQPAAAAAGGGGGGADTAADDESRALALDRLAAVVLRRSPRLRKAA